MANEKNFELFVSFDDCVKKNDWNAAKKLLSIIILEVKPLTFTTPSANFKPIINRAIKNCVRAGEYFDLLQSKEFDWLGNHARNTYLELIKTGTSKKVSLEKLHMALNFVLIEFRRNYRLNNCNKMVEEISDIAKSEFPEAALDKGEIMSFWSRLNFYRYQIATRLQERFAAEKFLDMSSHFIDSQALIDVEKARDILYLKTVIIGLARVFLRISEGRYEHAYILQQLIANNVKKDDPLSRLRGEIAGSVCRRSLWANSPNALVQVENDLEAAIRKYKTIFPQSRLLMRLAFEQSLTILLQIGLEKVPLEKEKLCERLCLKIADMRKKLEKVSGQNIDLAWMTQLNILEARLNLSKENFKEAEKKASEALELINRTHLKLLQIEARIALAVVYFRRENFKDAIDLLTGALDINKQRGLIADIHEYTQPELTAVIYLYLARIHIRIKDQVNALRYLEDYRNISQRIEHVWILERLAPDVEKEIMRQFLSSSPQNQTYHLMLKTYMGRKETIERASNQLKTDHIVSLANHLSLSPQTLYNWLRELESEGIAYTLYRPGDEESSMSEKERELKKRKEEIENAYRILGTRKKSRIAQYLQISRQTLYNRINELKEAGISPV